MNVLGISCHYHDSAACLVSDGRVVAAAQEERFNRRKYAAEFPDQSVNYCLQEGNITILDVDHIAFYEKPYLKLGRVLTTHLQAYPRSFGTFLGSMPQWLSQRLTLPLDVQDKLAFKGKMLFLKHHLAHAASSFLVSPFEEAAILTADGLGEWATTTCGVGRGSKIEILEEMHYPDSLGLVYSALTSYLGFAANGGEGIVMALGDFGQPTYLDQFRKMVHLNDDGSFRVDRRYFEFVRGQQMYSRRFVRTFGPPRVPEGEMEQRHRDLAASLQKHVEEILLALARHAHQRTKMKRLCLAGGVFLNCVANARILQETPFEQLFVQPAAGDAGGALGAAVCVAHSFLQEPRGGAMHGAYLGPSYSAARSRRCMTAHGLSFCELPDAELARTVARMIADNKIVGWCRGRMEFGPRALGARSILANPCHPDMKDILNLRVKHREPFRPYGVSILQEHTSDFFDFDQPSPFMLLVAQARPQKAALIPSALHVDGSSRLQTLTREHNGLFYEVVKEFRDITGIPMVINTSFNDRGEPIVCTPEDACNSYLKMEMDALVVENCLTRKAAPEEQ